MYKVIFPKYLVHDPSISFTDKTKLNYMQLTDNCLFRFKNKYSFIFYIFKLDSMLLNDLNSNPEIIIHKY